MPHSKRDNLIGSLLLTLCAIVWGSSFVAQSEGAQFVDPFTFISIRSLLGSAFLLPVTWCVDAYKKKKGAFTPMDAPQKRLFLKGGLLCGTALTAASVLQQFGIDRGTASGKAGFITALYIPSHHLALRRGSGLWLVSALYQGRLSCAGLRPVRARLRGGLCRAYPAH